MKLTLLMVMLIVPLSGGAFAAFAAEASDGIEDAVAAATSIVRPSVVAVETRFDEPVLDDDYFYWQVFRGPRPLYGLWGTGFIWEDPNYVITTSFLMDPAKYIRVILEDGRSYRAELVGEHEDLEIAVLKVDWGPDLEPVAPPIGTSYDLRLGQPIAIVGKALNSVDTYATAGVISAIRKQIPGTDEETDTFLQFDASYELSFTGAPIVDVKGNIVGMVDRTIDAVNINLGVPIDDVRMVAQRLISGTDFEIWFGVEAQPVTGQLVQLGYAPASFDWDDNGMAEEVDFGMWVSYISPGSPADIGGLAVSDVIIEMENQLVKEAYNWNAIRRGFTAGEVVQVEFLRKNAQGVWERKTAQVIILQKPEDEEEEDGSGGGNPHH